jgi:hypothetical protein
MEGRAVGHNFERDPPKDHPCQVWFHLVQGFQRRRFKCESLRRTPSDGKNEVLFLHRGRHAADARDHMVLDTTLFDKVYQ